MTTLLIAEHEHEVLKDATNKALTVAAQLGGEVHVLVAGGGQGTKVAAEAAVSIGALPPAPVAWKVEVRTVITFLASLDFTVWIALPA